MPKIEVIGSIEVTEEDLASWEHTAETPEGRVKIATDVNSEIRDVLTTWGHAETCKVDVTVSTDDDKEGDDEQGEG